MRHAPTNDHSYIAIPEPGQSTLIAYCTLSCLFCFLFVEGVCVTKKDLLMVKHPQIEVPQIHVVKLMQSLKSRNLVKEGYNWQYLYYTLTDEGIEYLREYLHVSADTVPATLKKAAKPQPPPSFGRRFEEDAGGRGILYTSHHQMA